MDPQTNPLFQNKPKPDPTPAQSGSGGDAMSSSANPAIEIIRKKLGNLYAKEPSAKAEMEEIRHEDVPHSKHQQYLKQLTSSGLGLAEIQTKWHEYYAALPDHEKHDVWQEFYSQQSNGNLYKVEHATSPVATHAPVAKHAAPAKKPPSPTRTVQEIKRSLLGSVAKGGKKKPSHLHSLIFGVGMGAVMVLILLFGFFNERFIAPFITPSKTVTNTPIIVDPASTTTANAEPKIIIPKINVEVPVVYDAASTSEDDIQKALENGVVHYVDTATPGQNGNVVIVGHSSNNIFNQGKYKFAFVLLRKLENDDLIIIHKDSKRYVYKVYEKKVVGPNDVSVLNPKLDKPATITLITCDPPGTSVNRLIIHAEQITPDPSGNNALPTEIANNSGTNKPKTVPGNAPSLWSRFTGWIF